MKKFAVIVAGGNGSRMKAAAPKQFLLLNGKPVLFYSIDTFLKAYPDCSIIVVLPEDHIATGKKIIDHHFHNSKIQITAGGQTRFHSVQKVLKLVNEEAIVFVHDAVRCLLSKNLVHDCYEAALQYGSAIPVIDCKDSVRLVTGANSKALERQAVKLVQTPQTFQSKIVLRAFNVKYSDTFTDEATVAEASGLKMHLIKGEENNIKITHPVDLILAEKLLNERHD